jgi:anti-sigma factor RsiW
MKCEEVKTRLTAYLDGELSVAEADAVREHLSACEQCAAEYKALAATWEALLVDEDAAPPAGFRKEFWQKVEAEQKHAEPSRPVFRRLLKWSPAMAAGFTVAFLAGWLSARSVQPSDTPDAATQSTEVVALLQNLEVIERMDVLEDLPVLQAADLESEGGGQR